MSRIPRSPDGPAEARIPVPPERDLKVLLAVFWLISAVRAVGALVRHEVFGAEATMALVAVLVLPWLALRPSPDEAPLADPALPRPIPFVRPAKDAARGGTYARKHLL
jgi:hypothetical protein